MKPTQVDFTFYPKYINSPTERISQFLDHFLQPCLTAIKSYVKDTGHFIFLLKIWGSSKAPLS